MPDYQFNTDLGPKAQQGTNIADMVNLARGVQAYQQAQELNPLAVQKAKMEIEQAQKLNPLAVGKAEEELAQAKIGTQSAGVKFSGEKMQRFMDTVGARVTDQTMLDAVKNKDTAKVKDLISGDIQELIKHKILSPAEAMQAGSRMLDLADKDLTAVVPALKNLVTRAASPESRLSLQTPQLGTVAGAPATFVSGTGTATPLTIGGAADTGVTPTGGQANQAPAGVTSTQMSLPYPVRKAGDIRPLAPTEEKDKEAGFIYRDSLAKATQKLSTSLRNLDEVIKTAEKVGEKEWMGGAGVLGSAGRNLSVFLGTEQGVNYKRLSKDLANLQISLGADTSTDAGKQLLAAASGDITLPPDILMEIARRTRADRQNIEMQAKGAQVFSQKYGDANLKKFQEEWTNNSKDSKVFEAISIYNSDMSQEDKQKEINKLFAGASPSYLAKVKQYRNNLIKLSETGGL